MIVRGRVVDAEGRPVAGAHVSLRYDFAAVPAIGQKGAKRRDEPPTAITGAAGEYVFDIPRENRGPYRQHNRALCALHGERVSQKIVIDWTDEPVSAADLVLSAGVVGRVRAGWDDGSPAAGVSIQVTLEEAMPEGEDVRAGLGSFDGVTDEQGELSFGPVSDVVYGRIIVSASHPDAPTRCPWWDGQRVSSTDPIELSLFRGRVVRGRLRTPDGQPAAGYRVTPWGGETGDPRVERATTTDASGDFEVRGVGSQNGAIAVYEGVPRADPKDTKAVAQAMFARVTLGHPLLIREVPPGQHDLGTVSIPALGTLTLRLEDARGAPVRSGSAWWTRPSIRHGGRGHRPDASGILRLERVPLGIAIVLYLTFDDQQHGKLEQAHEIPEVSEQTATLRLTGAGTVLLRLHPKGVPDQPLTVSYVCFGEHECHGAAHDEPLSELRWWTWPGFYPSLEVRARGFRKHVIENVQVSDAGPTFLDVELEPL